MNALRSDFGTSCCAGSAFSTDFFALFFRDMLLDLAESCCFFSPNSSFFALFLEGVCEFLAELTGVGDLLASCLGLGEALGLSAGSRNRLTSSMLVRLMYLVLVLGRSLALETSRFLHVMSSVSFLAPLSCLSSKCQECSLTLYSSALPLISALIASASSSQAGLPCSSK